MKHGYKTLGLATALTILLIALPARADALANVLAEALEQAWLLHPQSGALAAREAEAGARAELAASLTPGPSALSLGHLNDRLGSDRGKQEWEVELATPLWLPGQKAGHAAESTSMLNEIAARRAALRLELAGELRSAWWAMAAARQVDDLAQRRLDSARVLEADVLRRYRAGDLARVDANQARGETLAAQAETLEAAAAMQQAERTWRSLTNTPAPTQLDGEAQPRLPEPDAEHPRLMALASAVQVARSRLKIAQVTQRDAPELAVRLLRERGDASTPYDNAIGIKLTIPFSSGPRLRRDDAAARAEVAQADAERLLATRRISLDIEQARLELTKAERVREMALTRRELTADTLRLAEKTFSLGESDLTALLRARAAAFEAEAQLNRQESARGQALSQLKQALGEMP